MYQRQKLGVLGRLGARALGMVGAALAALPAFASSPYGDSSLNMPVGVTPISREVHSLHMLIFWVCVAIAVVVFGAMIYSIINFRKSKGAIPDKTLTHSTKVEIVWTAVPVLILVSMAVPAARTLIDIEDTRNAEVSIKVTGYQWKWGYEYLGEGVSFYSNLATPSNVARQLKSGIDPNTVENYLLEVDRPVVVPVDTKVRVLITGNDVIHSWWMPQFAVKKDAIPGFVNEAWFKAEKIGTYRGQCTELCGRDHGFMPIVVEVVSKEDYAKWLTAQKEAAKQAAAADGAASPATAQAATAPAATTAMTMVPSSKAAAAAPVAAAL
jgi:cytochrome c oxidase subunit 2